MNMQANTKVPNTVQDITEALAKYDLPAIRRYQDSVAAPDLSHIPGDYGMPVLGNMYWFLKDVHKWWNQQYQKHGPVFKMRSPMGELVFLMGPEANSLVFQNKDKIFSNFLAWDITFNNLFDNNLLERDFANHKAQRKILQAAFKRPAIIAHMEMMNPLLSDGIDKLSSGKTIKALDFVKKLLLDTGAKVFLGMEIGDEADKINKAFEAIVAGTTDPFRKKEIWFSPYAKGIKGNKIISDFIFKAIPERRTGSGQDIFSQFCRLKDDDGRQFTDEEIRDHIIFVLFAAHDTTTSALSSVMYSLATHPEWQETLRQEINAVGKQFIDIDDLDLLVKTGWTFEEALRMYPPLVMMPRFALEDFEFGGYRIPANTGVAVSSLFTHYMPEYWTNPTVFDPLRFSPERDEHKKDFYQYVPFGGGAHKCLGLHFAQVQGKMVLYYLLKNYRITKNPKMTDFKYNNVPLTFPSDGLPLAFHKIN
ncbi:MAG: cytochrome P450 [Pseudomonadales bacterium]|nr:cytochrome P450 [Pseudomonadales bacterium]